MKLKIILLVSAVLMATVPARGDTPPDEDVLYPYTGPAIKHFFEIFAGLNGSESTTIRSGAFAGVSDSFRNFFSSSTGLGFHAGLGYGIRFSPLFSLRIRAAYDNRTTGRNGTYQDSCLAFDRLGNVIGAAALPMNGQYTRSFTYATVSVLPALHWDDWFFMIGPCVSYQQSQSGDMQLRIADTTGVGRNCRFFPGTSEESTVVSGSYASLPAVTRYAVQVLAGREFPVTGNLTLTVQGGASFGIGNTLAIDASVPLVNPNISNPVLQLKSAIYRDDALHSLQALIGLKWTL